MTRNVTIETYEKLRDYVQTKNYTQCFDKIKNLKSLHKTYQAIINSINLKAKLDRNEIQAAEQKAMYVRATKLDYLFQKVKQIESLQERALNFLEANLNVDEMIIEKNLPKKSIKSSEWQLKRLIASQNQKQEAKVLDLKMLSIENNLLQQATDSIDLKGQYEIKSEGLCDDTNHPQNRRQLVMAQKSEHGWSYLERLRYIVFLLKYKDILQKKTKLHPIFHVYQKMADFIQRKCRAACQTFHRQLMKKFETVEKVIQHIKEGLWVTEQLVNDEIYRMELFYQRDCLRQLKSFKDKHYEQRSANQDLKPFVQLIKQQIEQNIKKSTISTKNHEQNLDQKNIILENQEQLYEQGFFLVKIPYEVEIQFQRKENFYQKSTKETFNHISQQRKIQLEVDHHTQKFIENKNNSNQILNNSIDSDSSDQWCQEQKQEKILPEKPALQTSKDELKEQSKKVRSFSYWTISENINFIAFIAVNRNLFIPRNFTEMNQAYDLMPRLAKYINTDKNEKRCYFHFTEMKGDYENDTAKMIDVECQKLGISEILASNSESYNKKSFCFEKYIGNSLLTLEVYPRKCIVQNFQQDDSQIEKIIRRRVLLKPKLTFQPSKTRKHEEKNDKSNKNIENGKIDEGSQSNENNSHDFIKVKIKLGIEAEFYDVLAMQEKLLMKGTLKSNRIRILQPVLISCINDTIMKK